MRGMDYRVGSVVEYVPFASVLGEPRRVRVVTKFEPLGGGGPWFDAVTLGFPKLPVWAYESQITEVVIY